MQDKTVVIAAISKLNVPAIKRAFLRATDPANIAAHKGWIDIDEMKRIIEVAAKGPDKIDDNEWSAIQHIAKYEKIGPRAKTYLEHVAKVRMKRKNKSVLGIHSSATQGNFTDGHAWISISQGGVTKTIGLWPDDHPATLDNGSVSDVRRGMENNSTASASRYYQRDGDQTRLFKTLVGKNWEWTYTNTCASFASEIVAAVVGEDVDADDYMGFETPRELVESIRALERKDPTSLTRPKPAPKSPVSSAVSSLSK